MQMNKYTLLLILFILTSCHNSKKENKIVTEQKPEQKIKTINDFIPNGFEIAKSGNVPHQEIADLNNDGIFDYIILLASGINDNDYSNSKIIKLTIFEGQSNGTYKLKSQTGNLTSSFLHTNSSKRVEVLNLNEINLNHQSMRHDYSLKFKYIKENKNYMLIGSEYNNYGNSMQGGAGNISINYLSGKKISTIGGNKTTNVNKELIPISAINDFNIYKLVSE